MTIPTIVTFEGEQTIRTIAASADRLRDAMAGAEAVAIECGGISEVDLCFVQMLLAARKTARGEGMTLCLAAPASGALLACLRTSGFLHDEMAGPLSCDTRFWMKRGDA